MVVVVVVVVVICVDVVVVVAVEPRSDVGVKLFRRLNIEARVFFDDDIGFALPKPPFRDNDAKFEFECR